MTQCAGVAELVDAPDSKSGFFGSASSILALGTTRASEYYSQFNYTVRHTVLKLMTVY